MVPLKEYGKYINYNRHWLHLKLVKPWPATILISLSIKILACFLPISFNKWCVCTNHSYDFIYIKFLSIPILKLFFAHCGAMIFQMDHIPFKVIGSSLSVFPPTSPNENKFPVMLICLSVSSWGRERKINLSAIWIYLRHRRYILAFELQTELIPYMLEAIYLLKNNSAEQFLTKRYASTFYRSSNKIITLLFFIVSLKMCKSILI